MQERSKREAAELVGFFTGIIYVFSFSVYRIPVHGTGRWSPQNPYVEILIPNVTVFEVDSLGGG